MFIIGSVILNLNYHDINSDHYYLQAECMAARVKHRCEGRAQPETHTRTPAAETKGPGDGRTAASTTGTVPGKQQALTEFSLNKLHQEQNLN